jgi:superfamily II DNA or RNA helicase
MTFDDFLIHLNQSAHGKGKAFEEAVEWWLTNDIYWGSLFEPHSVAMWERSDFRDGVDIGIDLTARDRLGNVWAIQVKNWSQERGLPKSEIDKFLATSNTAVFQKRLLITTTTSMSPNAIRAIESQEKPVVIVDLEGLRQSEIWGGFLERQSPLKLQAKNALPHQSDAIEHVTSAFAKGAIRTQLVMACGSGKTLTAQRIAETLDSHCTLVLVPSLLLLQQTRLGWLQDKIKDFQSLAVCSDESVVADQPTQRTLELPFPVTTDSNEILDFLKQQGRKVVFSTYQSFDAVSQALHENDNKVDLVICDEAHRLAGSKDSKFGKVLRDAALEKSRYLFMTATPKYFVSKKANSDDIDTSEVVSMSDAELFGEVSFSYSFASAIRDGRLADYRLIIAAVTDSQVLNAIRERKLYAISDSVIDGELLASHFGLAKAMRDYSIQSVISFHSRVSRAKDFVALHSQLYSEYPDQFQEGNLVLSTCLTGSDPSARRKQILSKLGNIQTKEFGLVSNARCLTEGVDVPNLDAIAFIDPKSSQIDIVQAVGRAIRKGTRNKKIGYLIVPIFVDENEIRSGEIPAGRFKAAIEVINALRAHDEGLVIELDSARRQLGAIQRSEPGLPDRIVLDIPSEVPVEFAERIQAFLIRSSSQSWEEKYGRLQDFLELNGHLRVPSDSDDAELASLYSWMSAQRALHAKTLIREDRRTRLEALRGWTWEPFDSAWETGLAALRKHLANGGSTTVPRNFTFDGVNLFNWMRLHRNKSYRLSKERKEQLEALPGWRWNPFQDQWDSKFEQLRDIVSTDNNFTFKSLAEPQRSQLREWLTYQRKHRFSRLDDEQRRKLESLNGWTWAPLDKRWEKKFALLQTYVQKFGTSRVPAQASFEGVRLGAWVSQLRAKRESLEDSKISDLESLPDWTWSPLDDDWDENFDALQRWAAAHPHTPVTSSLVFEGKRLGDWQIRQKKRRLSLEKSRIERLESLANWEWDKSDPWESNYELLLEYLEASSGNLPTLSSRYKQVALGTWLDRQRRRFSDLDDRKKKLLSELPGWEVLSSTSREINLQGTTLRGMASVAEARKKTEWDSKFSILEKYVQKHGTSSIPKSEMVGDFELGMWVKYIRSKREGLDPAQLSQLEGLPGWTWDPLESRWLEKFEALKDFCKESGHARVAQGVIHKGQPLGTWVSYQRKHKQELGESKVKALESLPGWSWDPKEDDWQNAFRVFSSNPDISFAGREGRTIVIDGIGIGAWLRTQRLNFDKLSPEKQAALRACPNWVW